MKHRELIDFLNAQADFLQKHMAHLYEDFGEKAGIPKMKMFRESAAALQAAEDRIKTLEETLKRVRHHVVGHKGNAEILTEIDEALKGEGK